LLEELAEEEERHREKLERAKDSDSLSELGTEEKTMDMGILDHAEEVPLSGKPNYQEILIFAGKREKETHTYYAEMASKLHGTDVGRLFERLAQEELNHKAKIEQEYERVILREV
jgi:rubrerythrin